MLIIAKRPSELDFTKLMAVYRQSNLWNAAEFFPDTPRERAITLVEERFSSYIREEFFQIPGSFYAVLSEDGEYRSALRLESYRDGMLVEAMETVHRYRSQGYASSLLFKVMELTPAILYSHVEKRNAASLRVHAKCGFRKLYDYAAYIDGSVSQNAVTLCCDNRIKA